MCPSIMASSVNVNNALMSIQSIIYKKGDLYHTQVAYGYMRVYPRDETNGERRGQEMRGGRMNMNVRTSVASPRRHADGAICRDVSPPHPALSPLVKEKGRASLCYRVL